MTGLKVSTAAGLIRLSRFRRRRGPRRLFGLQLLLLLRVALFQLLRLLLVLLLDLLPLRRIGVGCLPVFLFLLLLQFLMFRVLFRSQLRLLLLVLLVQLRVACIRSRWLVRLQLARVCRSA